jgi:hypothetical protein
MKVDEKLNVVVNQAASWCEKTIISPLAYVGGRSVTFSSEKSRVL